MVVIAKVAPLDHGNAVIVVDDGMVGLLFHPIIL
jgi:hypothetical protein